MSSIKDIQRELNLILALFLMHESDLIMIDNIIILCGVVLILGNFMIFEEEEKFLLDTETAECSIFYHIDIRYQIRQIGA